MFFCSFLFHLIQDNKGIKIIWKRENLKARVTCCPVLHLELSQCRDVNWKSICLTWSWSLDIWKLINLKKLYLTPLCWIFLYLKCISVLFIIINNNNYYYFHEGHTSIHFMIFGTVSNTNGRARKCLKSVIAIISVAVNEVVFQFLYFVLISLTALFLYIPSVPWNFSSCYWRTTPACPYIS